MLSVDVTELYILGGKATSATVDMGKASLDVSNMNLGVETAVDHPITIDGVEYSVTCVDMGNPHCVVFFGRVDRVDVAGIGPKFEHAEYFPDRVNTEFIRVVNPTTIKMRVWERGSGETMACGTGACAAVVAAVENGLCAKGTDVTVKVGGGDLLVNYSDDGVTLTGDVRLIYTGETEY